MAENNTSSVSDAFAPEPEPARGLQAFLRTKSGRLVVGGVAALLLVAGLGFVTFQFMQQPDSSLEAFVPPAGAVDAPSGVVPASDEETDVAPAAKPLSSTFAFRDVFVPTVKPAATTGSTTTTTTVVATSTDTDDGTTTASKNTLLLKSVSTEDGEPVAVFVWNSQTYELSEGDQLGDTPWQVVSISGNTVVMLYGDNRVTLTVGQGVAK